MDNRTIFECRACGDATTDGNTDGTTDKAGWSTIANIDGPSHICAVCTADPASLDHLKDEYPNVRISEFCTLCGKSHSRTFHCDDQDY